MDANLRGLHGAVDALEPDLVALRRDLHAHPELSRQERRTTTVVADRARLAGLRVTLLPGTGLVAELGPEHPAYRVALRADMDALPLVERTGLPWSSRTDGVAHACGHDVHVAATLGAGLALARAQGELHRLGVGVRLIFQAAEEVIPGGASEIVDQGWMSGVDRVYAVHCDPTLDVGQVGLRVGALTAAADAVQVTLKGNGGHTSRPHLTQDLTYALAKVVTDVPAALSRRLDPRAGAALVWGSIHAGGAGNVIPSAGVVSGTLRLLDAHVWQSVGPLVEELVHAVVAPYAVTAEVTHTPGVPPVVNDGASVEALRVAVSGAAAAEAPTAQSLGGEDFSWYLTKVAGAMARLGTRTPGGETYDLHRADFAVDEAAIGCGARVLAGAVVASVDQFRRAGAER